MGLFGNGKKTMSPHPPRDQRVPAEYWSEGRRSLDLQAGALAKLWTMARQDLPEGAADRQIVAAGMASYAISETLLWRILGGFSGGQPVPGMAEFYEDLVETVALKRRLFDRRVANGDHSPVNGWDKESYIRALTLLALGLCLGVPDRQIEAVATHVDSIGPDRLLDRLLGTRLAERALTDSFAFPRTYSRLEGVFDGPVQAAAPTVEKYLSGWYASTKSANWHESHTVLDPKAPLYFGYWCVEAAAVVAALGIDDSSFRGNEFYPADLADYAKEMSL